MSVVASSGIDIYYEIHGNPEAEKTLVFCAWHGRKCRYLVQPDRQGSEITIEL